MKYVRRHALIAGIICVLIVTLLVLVSLGIYTDKENKKEVNSVSMIYMSGITDQIAQHFSTIINLHLSQLSAMVETNAAEAYDSRDELQEALVYDAAIFGFDYMGLCSSTGEFDMVFGEEMHLVEPEPFLKSIRDGERKVAVAVNESGKNVVILGVATGYPMENGEQSVALVAGFDVDYFIQELSLNRESAIVNSMIIRKDGSYVLRNTGEFAGNYFEQIEQEFAEAGEDARASVAPLEEAIAKEQDYMGLFRIGKNEEYVYCTRIPDSEWLLITHLSYDVLNQAVDTMSGDQLNAELIGILLVIAAFGVVLAVYWKASKAQLHEIEEARNEAIRANQAKSEFLSNMSHDLRTPLNAIRGMTDIALAHIDNKEQVKNCLAKISLSGRYLLGSINDILDMSTIESGNMMLSEEKTSMAEVVEDVVWMTQSQVERKRHHLEVLTQNIVSEHVFCDDVRLKQVLLNLLSNAIKFTPDEGEIFLELQESDSPKGERYVHVHIKVKDNGIGIEPEFQKQIFDTFTRVDNARVQKNHGTGLGMAITKYIVDAMGGTIEFDSELAKGTEFRVDFDFRRATDAHQEEKHADAEETEAQQQEHHGGMLEGRRVLLAEDNELNMEVAKELLLDSGISMDWAENGKMCVEQFCKMPEGYYDAILMDIRMPVMNGYEAAKQIRELMRVDAPDIPIIAMTADAFSEDIKKSMEAGMNAHLSKPIDIKRLLLLLEEFATESEQMGETGDEYGM